MVRRPSHPLQLGDAVLVTAPWIVALEESLQASKGDVLSNAVVPDEGVGRRGRKLKRNWK